MRKLLHIYGALLCVFFFGMNILGNTALAQTSGTSSSSTSSSSTSNSSGATPAPFDPNQIQLQAPLPGQGSSINIKGQGAVGIMGMYVSAVYKFMLALIVIFAILMLMIAGYEYMFAGGDSGKTENAKTRAGQVLLGLVLAFMAAVLLNFINPNFFRL